MIKPTCVRIETSAELIYLRPFNSFIRSLIEQFPDVSVDEEELNNLELVFNEAYANINEHAYPTGEKGPIYIEIRLAKEYVEFYFEDYGKPFNPEVIPAPNLENPGDGGLGLWLMKSFMDEYEYGRKDDKNLLRLKKQFARYRKVH